MACSTITCGESSCGDDPLAASEQVEQVEVIANPERQLNWRRAGLTKLYRSEGSGGQVAWPAA